MTDSPTTACRAFDELAEELALGMVDEPRRSELLAHAATCARCQSVLDGLGSVVDRLLLVAPEVEPPAGFESRVLTRLGAEPAPPARSPTRWMWAAAAAVLLIVAGGLVATKFADDGSAPAAAAIVTADGSSVGTVRLVAEPAPHVFITIAAPRPGPGVRHCELQTDAGTWVEVGTWEVADIQGGVWAVGIEADLLDARAMRVTDDDGTVLATATFD